MDALEEAFHRYGKPDIFNRDPGSQYTSEAFTGVLEDPDIRVRMEDKGAGRDSVLVEIMAQREVRRGVFECR